MKLVLRDLSNFDKEEAPSIPERIRVLYQHMIPGQYGFAQRNSRTPSFQRTDAPIVNPASLFFNALVWVDPVEGHVFPDDLTPEPRPIAPRPAVPNPFESIPANMWHMPPGFSGSVIGACNAEADAYMERLRQRLIADGAGRQGRVTSYRTSTASVPYTSSWTRSLAEYTTIFGPTAVGETPNPESHAPAP